MFTTIKAYLKDYQKQGLVNMSAAEEALKARWHADNKSLVSPETEYLLDAMACLDMKVSQMFKEHYKSDDVRQAINVALEQAEANLKQRGVITYFGSDDYTVLSTYLIETVLSSRRERYAQRITSAGVPIDKAKSFYMRCLGVLFNIDNTQFIQEEYAKYIADNDKWDTARYGWFCRMLVDDARRYVSLNKLNFDIQDTDMCYGNWPRTGRDWLSLYVVRKAPTSEEYYYPNGAADKWALEFVHISEQWVRVVDKESNFHTICKMFGDTLCYRYLFMSGTPSYGIMNSIKLSRTKSIYALCNDNSMLQYITYSSEDFDDGFFPMDAWDWFTTRVLRRETSHTSGMGRVFMEQVSKLEPVWAKACCDIMRGMSQQEVLQKYEITSTALGQYMERFIADASAPAVLYKVFE